MQAAHPLCLHNELAMLPQVPAAVAGKMQATRSCVPAKFGPLHAYTVHLAVLSMLWKLMPCAEVESALLWHTRIHSAYKFFTARHDNNKASFGIQALRSHNHVTLRLLPLQALPMHLFCTQMHARLTSVIVQ